MFLMRLPYQCPIVSSEDKPGLLLIFLFSFIFYLQESCLGPCSPLAIYAGKLPQTFECFNISLATEQHKQKEFFY